MNERTNGFSRINEDENEEEEECFDEYEGVDEVPYRESEEEDSDENMDEEEKEVMKQIR